MMDALTMVVLHRAKAFGVGTLEPIAMKSMFLKLEQRFQRQLTMPMLPQGDDWNISGILSCPLPGTISRTLATRSFATFKGFVFLMHSRRPCLSLSHNS